MSARPRVPAALAGLLRLSGRGPAPALSSSCPRPVGFGPSSRPRAAGLPASPAQPAELLGAALSAARQGRGQRCPTLKSRRESLWRPLREGLAGCPGRARGLDRGSDLRRLAELGRAGQARAGPREPEEGWRGAAPRASPQGSGMEVGAASSGFRPSPGPLARGNGRCVRPRPAGPHTGAGRGRCGCRSGGHPTLLGLLCLPLAGPLQGQPSSLGGFRLLPGYSGAWCAPKLGAAGLIRSCLGEGGAGFQGGP